jgi:hypothetical protein
VKVLFAGPSLFGVRYDRKGIDVRPPARQGDLHQAVLDGATAIGLVDGVFGFVPSVWHKEILFAIQSRVHVLGAASLGALRAAECAEFGMEPVGAIAMSYLDGERIEDGDVCLAHAPEEMDFMPLSEPLVDAEATIAKMRSAGATSAAETDALMIAARSLYFGDRTADTIAERAGLRQLAGRYREHRVSAKATDALLLVERLRALPDGLAKAPRNWSFVSSDPWRRYLDGRAAG